MNEELKQIYEEDIQDRNNKLPDLELNKKDKQRKAKVGRLLEEKKIVDAQDYHYAALIFQHGETSSDFKKAHELAQKAVQLGDDSARWLYAATLDRFLLSEGKAQKFGTQFIQEKSGEWELAQPIDHLTKDKERKEWNVAPLKKALENFKQKHGL